MEVESFYFTAFSTVGHFQLAGKVAKALHGKRKMDGGGPSIASNGLKNCKAALESHQLWGSISSP